MCTEDRNKVVLELGSSIADALRKSMVIFGDIGSIIADLGVVVKRRFVHYPANHILTLS